MINPNRVRFARTRRGWTKTRLANALGVQTRTIHGYESGEYEPEDSRINDLSRLLGFPVSFFCGDDIPKISEHATSLRALSKMTSMLRNIALGSASIAFLFNAWLEDHFTLPKVDVPDLSDLSPENAAATLRIMWGQGQAPISNMIHLLESHGIRVYSLAIEAREVDAFSVWHEGRPFILLNTFKSAEHSRFDAAHELAHLVRDMGSMRHTERSRDIEREANAFAGAFLMPRESVIAHKPSSPGLSQLIGLKKFFGVSLIGLAHRLNQLNLLTEWTYKSLCMQIAKNGYRKTEPNPIQHETSQLLTKVFDLLRAEGISRADIARQLSIHTDELNTLTFGLAISAIASQQKQEEMIRPELGAKKHGSNLRLVKP